MILSFNQIFSNLTPTRQHSQKIHLCKWGGYLPQVKLKGKQNKEHKQKQISQRTKPPLTTDI